MEAKDVAILILTVVVIALLLIMILNFLGTPRLKSGHTEIDGFLELRAYPRISESVPTVMVYVLIPMYNQYEIYLTEDGLPLGSVGNFTENDLVKIEGVLYSRDAFDGSETYWMVEVFKLAEVD